MHFYVRGVGNAFLSIDRESLVLDKAGCKFEMFLTGSKVLAFFV